MLGCSSLLPTEIAFLIHYSSFKSLLATRWILPLYIHFVWAFFSTSLMKESMITDRPLVLTPPALCFLRLRSRATLLFIFFFTPYSRSYFSHPNFTSCKLQTASGPGSIFKAFLGSAQVRVPLSNKIRVRVGSVQHIYGSLRVRVRILGPVKTSNVYAPEIKVQKDVMHCFCLYVWSSIFHCLVFNKQTKITIIIAIYIELADKYLDVLNRQISISSQPYKLSLQFKSWFLASLDWRSAV